MGRLMKPLPQGWGFFISRPKDGECMAIRKKLTHDDKTREKIKTSQLLNRLQNHAFGKNKMTTTQIRAAEVCLKKTLPDLQSMTVGGPGGNAIALVIQK